MSVRLFDHYGLPLGNGHARVKRDLQTVAAKPKLRARYDAAQTTTENATHWANADTLDADAGLTPGIRQTLVKRSRYEVANGPYAAGIVATRADHEIGMGPTLRLLTKSAAFNQMVESAWYRWSEAIGLTEKLRVMVMARIETGEGIGIHTNNPAVADPVKLDLRLVETDQMSSGGLLDTELRTDGVEWDEFGNVIRYWFLPRHPGSAMGSYEQPYPVDARYVRHLYHRRRPGQHRGLPELTSSLPLFADGRRYRKAVLAAAESAADIAILLTTNLPPDNEADAVESGAVDIPRRSVVAAPAGWDAKGFSSTQPTTTFTEFNRQIVSEAARPISMPFNIAACDSSNDNFASGRLNHLPYYASVATDQAAIGRVVLTPLFEEWYREAAVVYKWQVDDPANLRHEWGWTGQPYSDPQAEASAIDTNLRSGNTTHHLEYSRRGLDAIEEWTKAAETLGITVDEFRKRILEEVYGAQSAYRAGNQANGDTPTDRAGDDRGQGGRGKRA